MSTSLNRAAWLTKAGSPLEVSDAPMPVAGPGEIIVKNAAIALNPLDNHMQDVGVFVQSFPAILGCDVAGEVYEVGEGVKTFKKGDRVIGHAVNLVTGQPRDGAYALYTAIQAAKASILPTSIPYTDGVVVPFAVEAAICTLSLKEPGVAMPGVSTPALALPYPSLEPPATTKVLVIYGGSSSVGSMTTQLATASGIHVVTVCGPSNFDLAKACGAADIFDRNDPELVAKVIAAVKATSLDFVGIFDAIASPATYEQDLEILAALGGGHLACVHPPPPTPANVTGGMIFAVNDVAAPVYQDYVSAALESGKLKCLPKPSVVGKGLESIDGALEQLKAGVSATKIVVEL